MRRSSSSKYLPRSDTHLKFARPSRSGRCHLIDDAKRRVFGCRRSCCQVTQVYPSGCSISVPLARSGQNVLCTFGAIKTSAGDREQSNICLNHPPVFALQLPLDKHMLPTWLFPSSSRTIHE